MSELSEEQILALGSSPDVNVETMLFPGLEDLAPFHSSDFSSPSSPQRYCEIHHCFALLLVQYINLVSTSPQSDFSTNTVPSERPVDCKFPHLISCRPHGSDKPVGLQISLLHKPRGSQGVWCPVQPGEGIRVTKGKGKRLKLQIKCSQVREYEMNFVE